MKRLPYTLSPVAHQANDLRYSRYRLIGDADVLTFVENELNEVWKTNYLLIRHVGGVILMIKL